MGRMISDFPEVKAAWFTHDAHADMSQHERSGALVKLTWTLLLTHAGTDAAAVFDLTYTGVLRREDALNHSGGTLDHFEA